MRRNPKVLAVMSPKGGVGKTVTTVNLAAALSGKFGKKVLAIDTNVSTASLGLHLNILYPEATIHDISRKNSLVEKAIYVYDENLHVIPASIKIRKKDKDIKKMRENLQNVISNYERLLEGLASAYDFILLDCSPGFDLESIAALHVAGGLLLVTNPSYPAIVTAAKAIEYAKLVKIPVGGIILNKVRNKKYEIRGEEVEEALQMKVVQEVPFDKKVPKAIANKVPIVFFFPHSPASVAYKKLAASLLGKEYTHGFFKRVKGVFKRRKS
jgi:MinD-like ATPase involved in chromosome partitioning or flagellar assembly